jgi:hypothetical protein
MAVRAVANFELSIVLCVLLLPCGCTSTNVTPIAANKIILSTSAAPVCGGQGAQRVASQQAAAETIRRGFDKYVIVGSQGSNDIRQIGTTPIYANTTTTGNVIGNSVYLNGTTNISGGQPIYGGSHNRDLAVVMFKNGDPQGQNALDARAELGADWQKKVSRSGQTCF